MHVPKTAGTSFRLELQKNQSVHMVYDYGEKSSETSEALRNIDPKTIMDHDEIFDADKVNFLCGHVHYEKYAHCVPNDCVISVVRNPVERLVSEYQHLRRHVGYSKSFLEFISSKPQLNKQSRILKGAGKGDGALIGLTSHYSYFLKAVSKKIGLPVNEISVNRAPESDSKERFNVPADEIKMAYELNDKDMQFFIRRTKAFSKNMREIGYNTVLPKSRKRDCYLDDNNTVTGWISCQESDCYFVLIRVNDEIRAVTGLDHYRQDIFDKELSINPVCGFNYPLSLLGVEDGDVITANLLGSREPIGQFTYELAA